MNWNIQVLATLEEAVRATVRAVEVRGAEDFSGQKPYVVTGADGVTLQDGGRVAQEGRLNPLLIVCSFGLATKCGKKSAMLAEWLGRLTTKKRHCVRSEKVLLLRSSPPRADALTV